MKFGDFITLGLIDVLGLIQGIFLGLFFIIYNKKSSKGSSLLGIFLIAYSADLVLVVLESAGYFKAYPHLGFLPIRFYLLFMPLLYLFIKTKTHSLDWSKDAKHLVPGFLEFGILTGLFILTFSNTLARLDENTIFLIEIVHMVIASSTILFYAFLILQFLKDHRSEVVHYFSSLEGKALVWVKWMVYYIILEAVLVPVLSFGFADGLVILKSVLAHINILFIFWVAYYGFRQLLIHLPEEEIEKLSERETGINRTVKTVEEAEYQRLLAYMEEQLPFTNEHLTIMELSRSLNMTKRHLSVIINEKTGKNFNQFINTYRVEKAKEILRDPKFDYLNMLGIAFQVGFSSKSSFYLTFKKMTGQTPAKYQKATR